MQEGIQEQTFDDSPTALWSTVIHCVCVWGVYVYGGEGGAGGGGGGECVCVGNHKFKFALILL